MNGAIGNHHPHPQIHKKVTLHQTLSENVYNMTDENGSPCGSVNSITELNAGKLTIFNDTVKLVACPLDYSLKTWLESERYEWIIDHESHSSAKDSCEMINSPLFAKDTLGPWLNDVVAMPRQVSTTKMKHINDNNGNEAENKNENCNDCSINDDDDCDTAALIKPGDIRTLVDLNNNTSIILVESIRHTLETAPQKQIVYRNLWTLRQVLHSFAQELGLSSNSSLITICNSAIISDSFQDKSGILNLLKSKNSLNLDQVLVLSSKYMHDVCYKDKNEQFTITE